MAKWETCTNWWRAFVGMLFPLRIVLMDDALDCLMSFTDFLLAFQLQFYYQGTINVLCWKFKFFFLVQRKVQSTRWQTDGRVKCINCCGVTACRVPAQRAADLPGSAGRKKSQHGHRSHVNLLRATPPCGRRGEWQGGAAGQRDAVVLCPVSRSPVWPLQALVVSLPTVSADPAPHIERLPANSR